MSALPDDVRALLQAAVDALDVPLADAAEDDATRELLLSRRASDARIILAAVLKGDHIGDATKHLLDWVARHPVTYLPWQARQDGGQS